MKIKKQDILDLNPCSEGLVFAEACDFDVVKIYNTCPRGDWLIWLLRRTNTITKPQSVLIAVTCAEHVLEIFEKKYPSDKRPRLAIEAVQAWLENPTDKNRKECRTTYADGVAADTYADTYADDDDARKVAYAAYAAAATAYATATATDYAAAYTADAADAAADAADARNEERQLQADKIREIVPCPFAA